MTLKHYSRTDKTRSKKKKLEKKKPKKLGRKVSAWTV